MSIKFYNNLTVPYPPHLLFHQCCAINSFIITKTAQIYIQHAHTFIIFTRFEFYLNNVKLFLLKRHLLTINFITFLFFIVFSTKLFSISQQLHCVSFLLFINLLYFTPHLSPRSLQSTSSAVLLSKTVISIFVLKFCDHVNRRMDYYYY